MEIMKNSPIIDIFGCMARIIANSPFDNEISFIKDGTHYIFTRDNCYSDDAKYWTLHRTVQNLNRYDVRYGEINKRDPITVKFSGIDRDFNGWDGSVSYQFFFDVSEFDTGYRIGTWDFEIKFPRELAKITTDSLDRIIC